MDEREACKKKILGRERYVAKEMRGRGTSDSDDGLKKMVSRAETRGEKLRVDESYRSLRLGSLWILLGKRMAPCYNDNLLIKQQT